MLLKGWKNWFKTQSLPKDTRALDPYLDANRKHFVKLQQTMQSQRTVTDTQRHAFVSAWLAFKRLEADDLNAKLRESFNASENLRFRTQLAHLQDLPFEITWLALDLPIRGAIIWPRRTRVLMIRFIAARYPTDL